MENADIEESQIQHDKNKLQGENTFGEWKKHWAAQEATCWSSGYVQIRFDKSQADLELVKRSQSK